MFVFTEIIILLTRFIGFGIGVFIVFQKQQLKKKLLKILGVVFIISFLLLGIRNTIPVMTLLKIPNEGDIYISLYLIAHTSLWCFIGFLLGVVIIRFIKLIRKQ